MMGICLYFPCRIKFEESSTSQTEFYCNDPEMPVHSKVTAGYHVGELVSMLMKSTIDKVCTVQPLGVSENASFVIDVEAVDLGDIKSDDLGSWHPTGTKKTYFRFSDSGELTVAERCPRGSQSQYYLLTRRYYVHKSYDKFHRQIADIRGNSTRHTIDIYLAPLMAERVNVHSC